MGKNIFNTIQLKKPNSNVFDLTHDVKTTTNMGRLTPVCVMEAIPGDKFNISGECLVRFAPLVAPVMHRMDVSIHYFFVPNRILWKGWEEFITGQNLAKPGYVERVPPTLRCAMDRTNFLSQLPDYMGVPFPASPDFVEVNALPFAAYQKIYDEYYRSQDLHVQVFYGLDDGLQSDAVANWMTTVRYRTWEHDYFTSCLPWAQKGGEVLLPLGSLPDVPVNRHTDTGGTGQVNWSTSGGNAVVDNKDSSYFDGKPGQLYAETGGVDLASSSVNDLRRAFRLQEWLEKNARAGTRYIESILAHFGVKSSDARLQRPEYITGIKAPVVISEVLNTTGEVDGLPQGNMAGHGVGVAGGRYGSYFCEEHGWIIGIMSVMPKPSYFQGLHKMFSRKDRFDYAWPEFANIGEQEVRIKELYIDAADKEATFGYLPRYAEYKFVPNRVSGEFQTQGLDSWHLARKFASEPQLNGTFLDCIPSTRIFAVEENADHLWCQVLNKVTVNRRLPKYGTPQF